MKDSRIRNPCKTFVGIALSSLALLSGGCSGEPAPEMAPATGYVKIKGEPAANILVQFLPQVPLDAVGPTSTGVTDEEGKFELATTDGKEGAVVGRCKVLLVDMDEERPAQGAPLTKPPRLPAGSAVLGPATMEVEVGLASEPFVIEVR